MAANLTKQHEHQIESLGLGIHLGNAKVSIENLECVMKDSSINEVVDQYCKNRTRSYSHWVIELMKYAEHHQISLKSALSVFNDQGSVKLKDLYWPSGFQNDASMKLASDFKKGNPLKSLSVFIDSEIESLEVVNKTKKEEWCDSMQTKLDGLYQLQKSLGGVLRS